MTARTARRFTPRKTGDQVLDATFQDLADTINAPDEPAGPAVRALVQTSGGAVTFLAASGCRVTEVATDGVTIGFDALVTFYRVIQVIDQTVGATAPLLYGLTARGVGGITVRAFDAAGVAQNMTAGDYTFALEVLP